MKISKIPNIGDAARKCRLIGIFAVLLFLIASSSHASSLSQADLDLIFFSSDGGIAKVEQALKAGANVNAQNGDGVTALIMGALEGQSPIVSFLLANHAAEPHSYHG